MSSRKARMTAYERARLDQAWEQAEYIMAVAEVSALIEASACYTADTCVMSGDCPFSTRCKAAERGSDEHE